MSDTPAAPVEPAHDHPAPVAEASPAPAAPPPPPAPAAPVEPAPPVRRPVEQWATAKGHYPQRLPRPDVKRVVRGRARVVKQAPTMNPHFQWFAAARHLHGWAEGAEVSEAEFDAAIHAAKNVVLS